MSTTTCWARPVPRQENGKCHGVVRAEFRVPEGIPVELRHGIFREPRSYPALVQFSNGGQRDESAWLTREWDS